MEDVDLSHAKEHLEDLVARASRGEDVVIVDPRYGSVRLTAATLPSRTVPRVTDTMPPFVPLAHDRVPGQWKDLLPPPPPGLFDPMSEEELKDWYGDDA